MELIFCLSVAPAGCVMFVSLHFYRISTVTCFSSASLFPTIIQPLSVSSCFGLRSPVVDLPGDSLRPALVYSLLLRQHITLLCMPVTLRLPIGLAESNVHLWLTRIRYSAKHKNRGELCDYIRTAGVLASCTAQTTLGRWAVRAQVQIYTLSPQLPSLVPLPS